MITKLMVVRNVYSHESHIHLYMVLKKKGDSHLRSIDSGQIIATYDLGPQIVAKSKGHPPYFREI